MNLLEAKKAYDEGKKIRHSSWCENDYCSQTCNVACLFGNTSKDIFDNGLKKYQEGWEIYVKTLLFDDIKVGQKFKYTVGGDYPIETYIKINSGPQNTGNALNLDAHCSLPSLNRIRSSMDGFGV